MIISLCVQFLILLAAIGFHPSQGNLELGKLCNWKIVQLCNLENCAIFWEEHYANNSCNERSNQSYIVCSQRSEKNDSKSLFNVSSVHEVKQLLNHVNFSICRYIRKQTQASESETAFCDNLTCNFSSDFQEYFYSNVSTSNSADDKIKSYIENRVPLLIVGLLSLLGNCIVIGKNVIALKKSSSLPKQLRIYNVLVLNLAISDLLMGIYLVAVGIKLHYKIEQDIYFTEIKFCNALGITHFVSRQVSLTLLLIISFFRLHSVKYPYKTPRFSVALGLVAATWVVWVIIAFIPTFDFEPFVSLFTMGIRFKNTFPTKNILFFYKVRNFLNKAYKTSCEKSQLHQILTAITKYPTIDVLIKTLDRFGLSQYESSWTTMGFYDLRYLCSTNYLGNSDYPTTRTLFVFCVVIYNLLCSISVVIAYLTMLKSFFENQRKENRSKVKGLRSKKGGIIQKPLDHRRNAENRRMFRLIAIVVFTDVTCWIPTCITSLVLYVQFDYFLACEFTTVFNGAQVFMSTAVIVNSIVNPYIYSFHFWKSLLVRLKRKVFSNNTTN